MHNRNGCLSFLSQLTRRRSALPSPGREPRVVAGFATPIRWENFPLALRLSWERAQTLPRRAYALHFLRNREERRWQVRRRRILATAPPTRETTRPDHDGGRPGPPSAAV